MFVRVGEGEYVNLDRVVYIRAVRCKGKETHYSWRADRVHSFEEVQDTEGSSGQRYKVSA